MHRKTWDSFSRFFSASGGHMSWLHCFIWHRCGQYLSLTLRWRTRCSWHSLCVFTRSWTRCACSTPVWSPTAQSSCAWLAHGRCLKTQSQAAGSTRLRGLHTDCADCAPSLWSFPWQYSLTSAIRSSSEPKSLITMESPKRTTKTSSFLCKVGSYSTASLSSCILSTLLWYTRDGLASKLSHWRTRKRSTTCPE